MKFVPRSLPRPDGGVKLLRFPPGGGHRPYRFPLHKNLPPAWKPPTGVQEVPDACGFPLIEPRVREPDADFR